MPLLPQQEPQGSWRGNGRMNNESYCSTALGNFRCVANAIFMISGVILEVTEVAKCANPEWNRQFRQLSKGRLCTSTI